MEDEVTGNTLRIVKMGADNNPTSTSRLVALQTRKQALEEKITLRNQELRRLCMQEAELTGVMPPEVPLEPGESLPAVRRRVFTSFEYPQNIINKSSNEEEAMTALETQIQVQKRIAEAALRIASDTTIGKSVKRKNMALYQQTKQQLNMMEERLENLKSQVHLVLPATSQNQQLKQKKKPRPPLESDNTSTKSCSLSQNDDTIAARSIQQVARPDQNHLLNSELDTERYLLSKYNVMYKNPNLYAHDVDLHNANNPSYTSEDGLVTTMSRATINSYSGVRDRRGSESSNNSGYIPQTSYTHSHSNPNIYQQQQLQQHQLQQQQQQQQLMAQNTHTLPHMSHMSPPTNQYQIPAAASHPNLNFTVYPHTLQYPSSRTRSYIEEPRKYSTESYRNGYNQDTHLYYAPHYGVHTSPQNYKPTGFINVNSHHVLSQESQLLQSQNVVHQQYESDVSSAGLGGHWMKTENGEAVWCTTVQHDDVPNNWLTDKRFGSLDRRKGKRLQNKRVSPNLDAVNKPAVKSVVSSQPTMLHPIQNTTRALRHDNRQLVRTQSLGSVGVQTVDSVCPSDDNSSYDSDGHSINELNAASRKLKQKGWCETSLDGPTVQSPQHITPVQEEIRHSLVVTPPNISLPTSPRTPKPVLEIPAESNPSPMHLETNIELYNNNVLSDLPKNCTVVQAGQCKPYREVTKPFEMSDFYKYSTKFRERNHDKPTVKEEVYSRNQDFQYGSPQGNASQRPGQDEVQDEVDGMYQKGIYQPLQPMKCQPLSPPTNFNRSFASIGSPGSENTSLDTTLALNTSNVAEHFSAEMNAWYQSHGQTVLDNNNTNTSPVSHGRSTATLV